MISAVAVLIVGVVAAGLLGGRKQANAAKVAPRPVPTTAPRATCPLTGAPAPGGVVPNRPALGIKIGNYPADRPSAGLNQADIVFEEPVEGTITRLVAIYQCEAPALVGDLRSARQPDQAILSQLSHPIFVHAGGINPVLAIIAASPLTDENVIDGNGSDLINPPGRVAPYSTFVNTTTMWGLDAADTSPPAPIFQYSASLPPGSVPGSGASVAIPFSSYSDVTWRWDAQTGAYLRFYSGQPDILVDGTQTQATNVVIMTVQTTIGPWYENTQGGREVEVTYAGTGPLVVMRNGVAITGTWARSSLTQPATLTASNGKPITLQPGNTWEELVPAGIPVTTTPATTATPP